MTEVLVCSELLIERIENILERVKELEKWKKRVMKNE
tara:strand:- start:5912 stop:6022 length:111 start_codon:yes stop_codon:yes gene_type:complete